MKILKIFLAATAISASFQAQAQVNLWPLGHGPVSDFAYAIGSNHTGDLFFVKSIFDETNGFYIDKIMHTTLDSNGNWAEPEMLPPPVNDNFNNSVVGINKMADTLYLLGNYKAAYPRLRPGLSYAVKNNQNQWDIAGVIDLPLLKPTTEFYGVYVSTVNQVLLASFKAKKEKSDDIYIARNIDGVVGYSELIKLPDYINTEASEISPFLSDDGKTLTFARWVGDDKTGNYEIFSCRSKSDDFMTWSTPSLVTSASGNSFDAYYWCCMDDYAFFSSDRDSIGKSSIYTFHVIQKFDVDQTANALASNSVQQSPTNNNQIVDATSKISGMVENNLGEFAKKHLALLDRYGDTLEVVEVAEDGSFVFNTVPDGSDFQIKAVTPSGEEPIVSEKTFVTLTNESGEQLKRVPIGDMATTKPTFVRMQNETPQLVDNTRKISGVVENNLDEFAKKHLALLDRYGDTLEVVEVAEDGSFVFNTVPDGSDFQIKAVTPSGEEPIVSEKTFVTLTNESGEQLKRVPIGEMATAEPTFVRMQNETPQLVDNTRKISGVVENNLKEFQYRKLALLDRDGNTLEVVEVGEDGSFDFNTVPDGSDFQIKAVTPSGEEPIVSEKTFVTLTNESGEQLKRVPIGDMATAEPTFVHVDNNTNLGLVEKSEIAQLEYNTPTTPSKTGRKLEGKITQNTTDPAENLHMIDASGSILSTMIHEEDGSFLFENFELDQMEGFALDNPNAEANSQVTLIDENGVESPSFAFSELSDRAKKMLDNQAKQALNETAVAATETQKPASSTPAKMEKLKPVASEISKPIVTETASSDDGIAVFFETNSAELSPKALYQLDKVKQFVNFIQEVKASADTAGSNQYNADLSQQRANAIAEYLKFSGSTLGIGEISTISSNIARSGIIVLNQNNLKSAKGDLFEVVLYHPFDKKTIEATSEVNLNYVAFLLKNNPKLQVKLQSNTDYLGDNNYNQLLSEKRAEYVKARLVELGVNENQIKTEWFGEMHSLHNCQENPCDKQQRALDRRTEVVISVF